MTNTLLRRAAEIALRGLNNDAKLAAAIGMGAPAFANIAAFQADTTLAYSRGDFPVQAGDLVLIGGSWFEIATPGLTPHYQTAEGVGAFEGFPFFSTLARAVEWQDRGNTVPDGLTIWAAGNMYRRDAASTSVSGFPGWVYQVDSAIVTAAESARDDAQAAQVAAEAASSLIVAEQDETMFQPGLSVSAYTRAYTGSPADALDMASHTVVDGALRITNVQRIVAHRAVTKVTPGMKIELVWRIQRIVDSASQINIGFTCLDASYAEVVGGRQWFTDNPVAADGLQEYRRVISDASGDGVDWTWPAGTVYIRMFALPIGTSHTTDFTWMSRRDITGEPPQLRDYSTTDGPEVWTENAAGLDQRRQRLKTGGPTILRSDNDILYVGVKYGDSTASARSAGWHYRLARDIGAEVWPHAVMLATDFAPGLDETTATVSPSALAAYSDHRNRWTSTGALGQPSVAGMAHRAMTRWRNRGGSLPVQLWGFTEAGIGGAILDNLLKAGAAKSGVDMYDRLMNTITAWNTLAAAYGMTCRVQFVELSIGSNDTAYAGTVAQYKADMEALIADLQTDIPAITSQPAAPTIAWGTVASSVQRLIPTLAQSELANDYRSTSGYLPLGPKYPVPFESVNHFATDGQAFWGEKVMERYINNLATNYVLYPSGAVWSTNTCTITIADASQLEIDTDRLPAHANSGFWCETETITNVAITGTNQVVVTFSGTPASGTVLRYALGPHSDSGLATDATGVSRGWGNIRDQIDMVQNKRSELVPMWTQGESEIIGRAHNGRKADHAYWLEPFELTAP